MPYLLEKHREDLTQAQVWLSRRLTALPHYHSGIEIAYVFEGEARAVVGGKSVTAKASEAVITSAYTVHSYSDSSVSAVVAILPPAEMPQIQKQLLSGIFPEAVVKDTDGTIHTLMTMLLENQDDAVMRKGLSYTLIGYLMKKTGFAASDSASREGIMAKVLGYLSENYSQNLTVESLAQHFGYSRSRFSHLFKSNIGVSFPRYINILRCRDAARALIETDLPVVDIAINAGFNNTHTFYVTFKSLYGMTPGEYVKNSGKIK